MKEIASHAEVLRASSRVPAPRTSADVRGAGTRDEPLRTSAWEAMPGEETDPIRFFN